jgi:hypothetical protein
VIGAKDSVQLGDLLDPARAQAAVVAQTDLRRLCRPSYCYLLGMYLGDGSIDRMRRTWRLRISLDSRWRGIVQECVAAMEAVFSANRVNLYQPDPRSRCVVAVVYSNHLVCLFPQHGPGPKHRRAMDSVARLDRFVGPKL